MCLGNSSLYFTCLSKSTDKQLQSNVIRDEIIFPKQRAMQYASQEFILNITSLISSLIEFCLAQPPMYVRQFYTTPYPLWSGVRYQVPTCTLFGDWLQSQILYRLEYRQIDIQMVLLYLHLGCSIGWRQKREFELKVSQVCLPPIDFLFEGFAQ